MEDKYEELLKAQKMKRINLILKYKKNLRMINLQEELIPKIKNGQSTEAIEILEKLNSVFRIEMLAFQNFHFYHRIINFVGHECFRSFFEQLDEERKKEMLYAQDGLIFKNLTLNTDFADIDGRDDFAKKARIFVEIDKKYVQEVFKNEIKKLEKKSEKIEMAFNDLIEIIEKSESNKLDNASEDIDELSRPRKKIHYLKKEEESSCNN